MPRPRLPHLRLPRTLRGRLTAALAIVFVLAIAVAALVTVLLVRHVLFDRLDGQLRAAGDRFAVSLDRADNDADHHSAHGRYERVEGQTAGTLGARIADGRVTDAVVVGAHDRASQIPASARRQLAQLPADGQARSLDLDGVGDYRLLVTAGRDGDRQVTGLPATPIEHTSDALVAVVVAVFAVALLVIVLISTGLLRVMLRPLARMSATAGEVATLPLSTGGVSLPQRVSEPARGSEVDTLARAFNAMLEQVESALQTRADSEERLRRFIADASHELRTPVAVVRSHAELARREAGESLPDSVSRSLERIAAQSERMGHLVEDLLLLARLDSGRPLAQEPVDIVRVVLDAVDDARTAVPDHHWRLVLPEDALEVRGDAHALGQVVSNLLSNAGAHTPVGTNVTITVGVEQRSVLVTVADDGPGMAPEVADHAFDRFVRGGGTERAVVRGSSGLGLPIVAAIAAASLGHVDLTSGDRGTVVRIELPLAPAPF